MKDRILNIGNRVEPFVDDWIIDRMDGINLKMHNPVDQEVVFKFDKPWEDICSGFMSVSKDGDIYRNWYRAGQDSNQFPAYVESSDGVSWTRPNLRKVEFNGSLSNNILFDDPTTKNMCVFIDTNPSANPKEKYKAIAHGPKINGRATIRGQHVGILHACHPLESKQAMGICRSFFPVVFSLAITRFHMFISPISVLPT